MALRISAFYKLAKIRKRRLLDINRMVFVKDSEGTILREDKEIRKRWKEYFDQLCSTKKTERN